MNYGKSWLSPEVLRAFVLKKKFDEFALEHDRLNREMVRSMMIPRHLLESGTDSHALDGEVYGSYRFECERVMIFNEYLDEVVPRFARAMFGRGRRAREDRRKIAVLARRRKRRIEKKPSHNWWKR